MTAIEKQIQAAEKRIAKFEKNVATYGSRVDKQLEKLQKQGFLLTLDDFRVIKEKGWKYGYEWQVSERAKEMLTYDQWYAITNNVERERENSDRLEDERKHLEELVNERDRKDKEKQQLEEKDGALLDKLGEVLNPFRGQWMQMMKDWHDAFYERIHKKLPEARIQYKELKEQYDLLNRQNGFRGKTSEMIAIEEKRNAYGRILSAPPAAWPTKLAYLEDLRPKLEKQFDDSLRTLAGKCRDFELDTAELRIHHPRFSERGLDVYMTDGTERVVDARMIWAAEESDLVTAHTRYIVTERRTPQAIALHNENPVKEETKQEQVDMEQQLEWKDKIDWQAYSQMLERELASERLLSLSNKEEYNPHPANIEDLEEELGWVRTEEYDKVIDYHIGEKGEEDAAWYFQQYYEPQYRVLPTAEPGLWTIMASM